MPGSLVVGQSGGVTPVINASLAGVLQAALRSASIDRIYGMRQGIRGLIEGDLLPLNSVADGFLDRLAGTPGAWLGSCRHAPDETELARIVERLATLDAHLLIYIGGNDSADTGTRVDTFARANGYELRVVNVPKTIDNDLPEMDHCPGYPTAAGYVALSTRLLCLDTRSMRREEPLRVIEVKGRYSGWLAGAAGALAPAGDPVCVCLPEVPLDEAELQIRVEAALGRAGYAVIVVSEHALGAEGRPVGAGAPAYTDAFGHGDSTAPGVYLRSLLEARLGRRCRLEVLGALQKVVLLPRSSVDREEAFAAGVHAVDAALAGESGVCVTLNREPGTAYRAVYGLTPLAHIARNERLLPPAFRAGSAPAPAFNHWLAPLIEDARLAAESLLDE